MTVPQPLTPALAALVPLAFAFAVWLFLLRRRRAARALGDADVVARLTGNLATPPVLRIALLAVAVLALAGALTDPRWGVEPGDEQAGIDLVLVQDASNSMLVEDVAPNRLELQRRLSRELLERRPGDRVGIVVFAGRAYILSPPTRDHGAAALFLDAVGPDIVEQTGSSLAAAIRQGTALLAGVPAERSVRVMVVSADGEVHGERDEVLAAARRARELGLRIHTVGIGTVGGGPVPDVDHGTGARRGFKVDPETGEVAISRADPELLREVARIGGGRFVDLGRGGSAEPLLSALAAERHAVGGDPRHGRAPRYGWFVGLALFALAAETAVAGRTRPARRSR